MSSRRWASAVAAATLVSATLTGLAETPALAADAQLVVSAGVAGPPLAQRHHLDQRRPVGT